MYVNSITNKLNSIKKKNIKPTTLLNFYNLALKTKPIERTYKRNMIVSIHFMNLGKKLNIFKISFTNIYKHHFSKNINASLSIEFKTGSSTLVNKKKKNYSLGENIIKCTFPLQSSIYNS